MMKNKMRNPRSGVAILFLCAAACLIWTIAAYGTYEESKRAKYNVRIKPGTVTYGTHSSAVIPMTNMSRSVAPMISGNAVRSYAHSGHATPSYYAASSGSRIYTTSSAQVHSIGAGGGGGGGISASGSSSSGRGISYGGGSVSMPTLAMNTPRRATTTTYASDATSFAPEGGLRRANPHEGEIGSEGDKYQDTENPNIWWYWDEDEEGWVSGNPPVGTIRWNNELGYYEEWNGSTWVRKGEIPDLGTPLGPTPWILMLLLAVAYVAKKRKTVLSSVNK